MVRGSQGKRTGGQEEMTKVAILGYGTVGSGVYEVLKRIRKSSPERQVKR